MLSIEEILKKEIVYKAKGMDDVNIHKDIVRKKSDNAEGLMDVYAPSGSGKEAKLPAVILIHGEAPSVNFKESGQYISYGKMLAASGYIAVNFNHKVLSEGCSIEEVAADIDMMIKHIIQNADGLNIDKNRIAIWCFSGGVPFGLYAGMNDYFSNVRCVIAYYGFGDFTSVGNLLQFSMNEEDVKKYSPINLISKNADKIPPLFIARAGLDSPIINESIGKFINEALAYNLTIDMCNHSTGVHGFDLFTDDRRTQEIMEKALNFLEIHMR